MGILTVLLPGLMDIFKRVIPDPAAQAQAQLALAQLAASKEAGEVDAQLKQFLAGAGIIQAEAQSANWLTSAWRPLTMLTFVALIVCRVFGITSFHVPDAEYMTLWDLVKLGLSGYVIGRSAEKTVPAVIGAITGALKK